MLKKFTHSDSVTLMSVKTYDHLYVLKLYGLKSPRFILIRIPIYEAQKSFFDVSNGLKGYTCILIQKCGVQIPKTSLTSVRVYVSFIHPKQNCKLILRSFFFSCLIVVF